MLSRILIPVHFFDLQVLGWEGLWGSVAMGFIGLPLAWVMPGPDIGMPINTLTIRGARVSNLRTLIIN